MPEEDTEIMTQYEDYSVEELRKALDTIMLYSELNDSDVAEMERILAVLRKKAPFPHPHTTEEMWAEFQADHAEELAALGIRRNMDTEEVVQESPCVEVGVNRRESTGAAPVKSHRRILRIGLIAAAIVVLLAAVSFTASALGFNLWGWVPKWGNDDLSFVHEEPEEPDLQNIPTILKALNITEPLYPTWLPEGFVLKETVIEEDPLFLYDAYSKDDDFISITITPSSHTDAIIYQRDGIPYTEFIFSDRIHYLFSDLNYSETTWNTGNYTVHITGSISEVIMKAIIQSIYKE